MRRLVETLADTPHRFVASQYDNAQRVDELGFGMRLDTYGHEPKELRAAVDRLLADDSVRTRLSVMSDPCSQRQGL